MAKGKKNSADNSKNFSEPAEEEATLDTAPAVPGATLAQDEPDTSDPTSQAEAKPFVFESISPPAELSEQPEGQFSSDEMEFESWMFDAGDGRGILMPETHPPAGAFTQNQAAEAADTSQAQDDGAESAPIIGRDMPTPDFVNAFVQDPNVPQSPMDMIHGSANDSSLDIENLLSGMGTSPVHAPRPFEYYPETPGGWNDQLLASVNDFSSVLLALENAPTVEAGTYAPPAPADAHDNAEAVTSGSGFAAPLPETAGYQEGEAPQMEAAPAETVQPPWQLGDLQEPALTSPDELTHDPSAYLAESQPGNEATPYKEEQEQLSPEMDDAIWAATDVPSPQADQSMEQPQVPTPDFSWLDEAAAAGPEQLAEQGQAQPEAEEVQTTEWPQEPAMAASVDGTAVENSAEGGQPATEIPAPAWSPVMDENLPPWLVEAAETGMSGAEPGEYTTEQPPTFQEPDAAETQWAQAEQYEEAAPFQADAFVENPAVGSPVEQEHTPAENAQTAGAGGAQPEGQFNGEAMEFESWMFDPGQAAPLPSLPGMGQFMPAVHGMEAAMIPPAQGTVTPADVEARIAHESIATAAKEASSIEMDSVRPADESLPFWLEDRSNKEQHPGEIPAVAAEELPFVASDVQAQTLEEPAEQTTSSQQPTPDSGQNIAELPPIEPFDFSMLQPVQDEETLGFSTEELASVHPQKKGRMVVTANLDVLADLLGKDRGSASHAGADVTDAEIEAVNALLMPAVKAPLGADPVPEPQEQSGYQAQEASPQAEITSAQEMPGEGRGWTAVETGQLPSEKLTRLDADSALVTPAPADVQSPVSAIASAPEINEEELNVSPFDIDELDLAAEENNTEYLTSSLVQRSAQESPQKILTGSLFLAPENGSPDYWEAPAWMADVVESDDDGVDRNTSRFSAPDAVEQSEETEATQYLAASRPKAGDAVAAVPSQPSGEFKARVSRFSVPAGRVHQEPAPTTPVPVVAAQAVEERPSGFPASAPAYGANRTEGERSQKSSAPASPTMISGPLPKLQGFEDLEQIVTTRPGEIGPLMALAVAYAQAGQIEHAIYEYHRLLQSRKVPAPMLQIIGDQLDEIENEAGDLARFHQVRGDLFMKRGMYEEAVEEYNRIK